MFKGTFQQLRCPHCQDSAMKIKILKLDKTEVVDGLLICKNCNRWYRIEDGIPDLMRDGLREVDEDQRFLHRYSSQLTGITALWKPFGLNDTPPAPSEEDQKIIEEGRHWGRFMQHFWDAGDRAIFDLAFRGSHPMFYVAGVIESDDRDHRRKWGNFSNRSARLLLEPLKLRSGLRALDLGCGGGQFGLAAARAGLRTIGFDPSFQEMSIGRRHAREQGIPIDYVRGEPSNPPFAAGAFDVLMAKDALHHVPDLKSAFHRLVNLLKPKGEIFLHEHVANASRKEWLMSMIRPLAVQKIRSRYANVKIPEELLRDSANEDVSADLVEPLARKYFSEKGICYDLYFANELEVTVHMAFGKRHWLSRPVYPIAMTVEKILILLGDRQHLSFVGQLKS